MRADGNGRVIIDTAFEEEHKFEQLLQKIAAKYFNCISTIQKFTRKESGQKLVTMETRRMHLKENIKTAVVK